VTSEDSGRKGQAYLANNGYQDANRRRRDDLRQSDEAQVRFAAPSGAAVEAIYVSKLVYAAQPVGARDVEVIE
jgi:hypothetical protein